MRARVPFRHGVTCGLSQPLLVLALFRGFFSGFFRFSSVPLQKPTFSDFNWTRIENLYENQLRLMCRALLRTFARKFSNIDFFPLNFTIER